MHGPQPKPGSLQVCLLAFISASSSSGCMALSVLFLRAPANKHRTMVLPDQSAILSPRMPWPGFGASCMNG